MKDSFTTSIVLCTYNGASFLPQQLSSILNQTVFPDELIIADDGSTDQSVKIAEQFALEAPFPVSIKKNSKQLGYTKNFISHFLDTTTDFVFFSDQDDVWYPHKIEAILEVATQNPEMALAFSNAELIDSSNQIIDPNFFRTMKLPIKWKDAEGDFFRYYLKNTRVINGCFSVFSKQVRTIAKQYLSNHPNYEIKIGHDHFLNSLTALFLKKEQVELIPEILMKYRVHKDQSIGVGIKTYENMVHKVGQKKKERFNHLNITEKHLKQLIEIQELQQSSIDQINVMKDYRSFNQRRMKNDQLSYFQRFFFSISHFLKGDYHQYCQFPFKELQRDLL